jgi:hypothetical protein
MAPPFLPLHDRNIQFLKEDEIFNLHALSSLEFIVLNFKFFRSPNVENEPEISKTGPFEVLKDKSLKLIFKSFVAFFDETFTEIRGLF